MPRSIAPPPIPPRDPDSHKGTYGRVLVVAGARAMPGAAVLAANGALRGGAGLVTVATPWSALGSVAPAAPCATYAPLAESTAGFLDGRALDPLLERAGAADVVVVGPGLGQEDGTVALVRSFVRRLERPLVLDADGLNAISDEPDAVAARSFPTVLTPHPGELSRLDRQDAPRGDEERRARAEAAARRFGAVVCLKGHRTVVTDGDGTYVNDTGNPAMATGGTGDVLAGLLGALVAQLDDPLDAAVVAVRVHGLAGDLARETHGPLSVIATDLLQHLGPAFLRYGVER